MTIIATVISKHSVAHASDSWVVETRRDGTREVKETGQTKIVRVQQFHGAMAYWGLAACDRYDWSALEWLKRQAGTAPTFESAEDFAVGLADRLNRHWGPWRLRGHWTRG